MQKRLTSKDKIRLKKQIFLLLFSRELINHSNLGEILGLRNVLDETVQERESEREKGKSLISSAELERGRKAYIYPKFEREPPRRKPPEEKSLREKIESGLEIKSPVKVKTKTREMKDPFANFNDPMARARVLRIPEPRLPERFQYLRPTPTKQEIDLGKLNPLIQDSAVKTIECEGPDERIFVTGRMGRKPTGIVLSGEEIDEIIEKFSEKARIPVQKGVFKVVVGSLVLSSVVSDVVGSRFVIKKIQNLERSSVNRT